MNGSNRCRQNAPSPKPSAGRTACRSMPWQNGWMHVLMLAFPSVGSHPVKIIIARSGSSVKTFSGLPFRGVSGWTIRVFRDGKCDAGGRNSPCRPVRREDDKSLRGFHPLFRAPLFRGAPALVLRRVAEGGIGVYQGVPGAFRAIVGRPDAPAARTDEFELGAGLAHRGLAAKAPCEHLVLPADFARYPVCVFQPVISLSRFSRGGPLFLSCSPSRERRKERSSRPPRCPSPRCLRADRNE